jgi:LysM repeat protein
MKRLLYLIILAGLIPLVVFIQPAHAQDDTVYNLIEMVNAYRASVGLPAYQIDSSLMAAAQSHTDWEASTGQITHVGPGGTRPRDRAIAAGYGYEGGVFVSENIYGGWEATPETAMDWWKNSQIHNAGLLSSTYQNIGAGYATDGTTNYFTLVFGYRVDGAAPPPAQSESQAEAPSNAEPAATVDTGPVFQLADPRPDGSIVHVVQEGQALWNISAAYDVPLPDLLALNNLTEFDFILPGDEIVVRAPTPPTSAPAQSSSTQPSTPTPTAIAVGEAPRTDTLPGENDVGSIIGPPQVETGPQFLGIPRRTWTLALIGTALIGAGMIVIGLKIAAGDRQDLVVVADDDGNDDEEQD